MACGTRTVNPGEWNKGLSSTFQPPGEGQSIQQWKRYDKHGDKDEDYSLKNVNNVSNNIWLNLLDFLLLKKKLHPITKA